MEETAIMAMGARGGSIQPNIVRVSLEKLAHLLKWSTFDDLLAVSLHSSQIDAMFCQLEIPQDTWDV